MTLTANVALRALQHWSLSSCLAVNQPFQLVPGGALKFLIYDTSHNKLSCTTLQKSNKLRSFVVSAARMFPRRSKTVEAIVAKFKLSLGIKLTRITQNTLFCIKTSHVWDYFCPSEIFVSFSVARSSAPKEKRPPVFIPAKWPWKGKKKRCPKASQDVITQTWDVSFWGISLGSINSSLFKTFNSFYGTSKRAALLCVPCTSCVY